MTASSDAQPSPTPLTDEFIDAHYPKMQHQPDECQACDEICKQAKRCNALEAQMSAGAKGMPEYPYVGSMFPTNHNKAQSPSNQWAPRNDYDALRAYATAKSAECEASKLCAQRNSAAANIVLMLVTLKARKDRLGKDAVYESKQPEAWALAKEFLQKAMPDEYAATEAALGKGGA